MPRIRTIKPKFWDDIKLSKISRDARLLYIGMWNFADDLGVIVGDSIWIKSKVFPYDQIQVAQFERMITELVKNGFISQLSHSGDDFYYLPNLTRHQVINRPNYDDVNLRKELLDSLLNNAQLPIMEKSLINHRLISAGKEKERKGEEGSVMHVPTHEDLIFEKFNNFIKNKAPRLLELKQMTQEQFLELRKLYSPEIIADYLERMNNYKNITKNSYVYSTLRVWIKKDLSRGTLTEKSNDTPKAGF